VEGVARGRERRDHDLSPLRDQPRRATPLLVAGLDLCERLDGTEGLAIYSLRLGLAEVATGQQQQAGLRFQAALEHAAAIGWTETLAVTIGRSAAIAADRGTSRTPSNSPLQQSRWSQAPNSSSTRASRH